MSCLSTVDMRCDAALCSQSFEEESANPGTVRCFVQASRSVNFLHFGFFVLAHFFDYSTFGVNRSGLGCCGYPDELWTAACGLPEEVQRVQGRTAANSSIEGKRMRSGCRPFILWTFVPPSLL